MIYQVVVMAIDGTVPTVLTRHLSHSAEEALITIRRNDGGQEATTILPTGAEFA